MARNHGLIALGLALALVWHAQAQDAPLGASPAQYLPLVANPISPSPTAAPTTIPTAIPTPAPTSTANCHPSYPSVCIPPPPPDLDCSDIPYRRFPVTGSDPHNFDSDNDGVGCEG
jgi:hypothetical protein